MLLAKSCYSQNNIKTSKTLKLGTLFEYRETEIKEIADEKEGTFEFSFFFDGEVSIKPIIYNTLAGGLMQLGPVGGIRFPGRASATFDSLTIMNQNADTIVLKDSKGTIRREVLNSFIFCMSHVRKTTHCHGIFPNYDDYWYAHDCNAEKIARILMQLLLKQIKKNQKNGQHTIPPDINANEIDVNVFFGNVKYTDRNLHFNNNSIHELEDIIHRMHHMAFIKPPTPFEKEKEYRFHFIITHKNRIIEPLCRHLILSECDELLPYVF